MKQTLILLLGSIILFTACRDKNVVKPGEPINVAFDKAMRLYDKGKYDSAAEAFEMVTRMGRGTNYARDAQFLLAESYFKDKQYLLAASEYERYLSYYPQDPKREEGEFKRALCYYKQSPRYKLDQTPTKKAIEYFQLFNNRYPDSEYVMESAKKIDELRSKLAHKTYEAAEFYLRTERYLAATIYYDLTIDQYPETEWAEKALIKQIYTYVAYAENSIKEKQAERYTSALDAYEKFLQLFPQSKQRGDAEKYHDEALLALSKLNS